MVRYSMLRLGRRKELVWTAFLAICIIYYLYNSTSGPPESVWIEQLMNDGFAKQPKPISKTTFDFSKVKPQYLQKNMKPMPTGRPLRMPRVQYPFRSESSSTAKTREYRRQEVRNLFYKNWQSYRKYAWKKDVLQPLSATFKDQFSGWAATLVDSLDTLWIMGFREEFDEAVQAVSEIDFGSATNNRVNTFETNIRYLGGLLAAYDLSKREILLQKATELGNLLYLAFNTENGMPVDFIDFEAAKQGTGLTVEWSVVSASPGTLSMEMTHLSQLTGDPKYYAAVARVMDVFYRGQNATELPGMWPMMVSMARQDVVSGNHFTIAGCADSLYEYLPKMHALLGGREPSYEVMSRVFMDVANRTLFFRPMLPGGEDVLIAGNADVINSEHDVVLDPESEHLACFIGGLYALGGKLFSRPDWVDVGGRLTDGCVYAYRAMPTGMMPERYNMVACPSRLSCPWDEDVWEQERKKRREWKEHLPKGFTTAKDPRYILRPEAIESVFVMWRTTGRREYQDAAWDMFRAVSNGTYTEYANAAVLDVTRAEYPLRQEDYMESFWLAETLKYFYLVFSPPDVISLDEWVLNTEAHPFRRPT